jgi:co-chaperonin GroES (HSP10)
MTLSKGEKYLKDNYDMELPVFAGKIFKYHVVVMPMMAPDKTSGGIILASESQDYNEHQNRVGIVVEVGPSCYKASKFKQLGIGPKDFPKRGDWVLYGQYTPMKVEQKGVKLAIMNDDDLLGVIDDPADFKAYIYTGKDR